MPDVIYITKINSSGLIPKCMKWKVAIVIDRSTHCTKRTTKQRAVGYINSEDRYAVALTQAVFISCYSGTLLNGHSSTAYTYDIADNS